MFQLHVKNEVSRLRKVVLGTAKSCGPIPKPEDAYDPKSLEHIVSGTYPSEKDMIAEIETFNAVFQKYDVEVFRPEVIKDCNQIFSRDIAFVIDDVFIKSNILPDREKEYEAIRFLLNQIHSEKIIRPPEEVHIEGGDVMPWNDYIFIGTYTKDDYDSYITARTNKYAVNFIQGLFPNKIVKPFELVKSNTNPRENALHLDCCFQPVGENKAILYKGGFLIEEEYQWLKNYFGEANIFEVTQEEMYEMYCNVFSIAPNIIVSEKKFTRLNNWLRKNNFIVEEIPYAEISKQGGLLRCSTMPLVRDKH